MDTSYNILIEKLDRFIRKYYQNQLIKGGVYTFSLVLGFFLLITSLEFFGEFSVIVRTILFYTFLFFTGGVFVQFIFSPISKILKIGTTLSNEQAAQIIGKHFSSVSDKLLNLLQLNEAAQSEKSELLLASIDQKAFELKPVAFSSAIDLSKNTKHLKYALPPLFLLILILIISPSFITQSTSRLVNHQTYFEKVAPFTILLDNEELEVIQNEDFKLDITIKGDEIPNEVHIELSGNKFRLKKNSKNSFTYLFKNIQKTTTFRLLASGFNSTPYTLKVLKKPNLIKFSVGLNYPSYLEKKDVLLNNVGDINVPEGTAIKWTFTTENTSDISFLFPDTNHQLNKINPTDFQFEITPPKSTKYQINLSNSDIEPKKEGIKYSINIVKDEFPKIDFEQRTDSLSNKRIYFKGTANDDYGLTRLTFNYKHKDSLGYVVEDISVSSIFFHYWDISDIKLNAGDKIDYFFQVWDNDGFNGRKSTKSNKNTFKAPTLDEIEANAEKANQSIKSQMEESIEESKKIQKEVDKIRKKLSDKKELSWEDKNKLKDLLEQQKKLEQKVQNIKNENKKNNASQNEYKKTNENILEKQRQIEELFEKVMTEEMKKLFEELEDLLEKANKQKLQEMLEDMKLSNEDLEKELDRTLELFKQLEFEQKMEQTIDKLNELAKKQEELSKETKGNKTEQEELQKKQEKLNKEFEKVQKDLDDLKEKNEALERPNQLPETDQQEKNIENEMNNSSESLENSKNKKASESQKNASDQMQQMAQQMQQIMDQMQQEANQEDIDALRQLLENLIQLSFDQEALMEDIKGLNKKDPKYFDIGKQQKKLQRDAKMIEDSLFALSKRNPQIEPDVNREINKINLNIEKALHHIQERQTNQAAVKQQYIMTATNNLALLLDEIVQQMQQQQSQQKFGNASCSKPGNSPKPKPGSMKQIQQQINKQIEGLKKGMKPGEKGQGKYGGKMSMELAKLAAEQEALRQQIQQLSDQLGKDGNKSGKGNLDKLSELMEETERDLVNRKITQETIKRQQEIMSRLLEHEKADREREFDNKREAKEAKNENFSNPTEIFKYNKIKEQEEELLRTVSPALSPFYKKKVNSYFQNNKQK